MDMDLAAHPVYDTYEKDGGRYAVGICSEITARKQAESALQVSEERYRRLFDRNLAGVLRVACDGRIVDCNQALADTLGYSSREELLGLSTTDLDFNPEAGNYSPITSGSRLPAPTTT